MATRDVARGEGGLLDQGQAVVAAVENILAVVRREDDDACRRAGEMRARCGRDVGEMRARCGRDAGEMWARCGRDVGETHTQQHVCI